MYDLAGRIGFWGFQSNNGAALFHKAKHPHKGEPDNPKSKLFVERPVMQGPGLVRCSDIIPPRAVLQEFARNVFEGNTSVFENAPKIPTKVLNIICELLFVEIFIHKLPITQERIKNFQNFIVAECVPWHTLDSVCRRLAKRRESDMQKWLLGHRELRSRILMGLPNDSRANYPETWWTHSWMPKRKPS